MELECIILVEMCLSTLKLSKPPYFWDIMYIFILRHNWLWAPASNLSVLREWGHNFTVICLFDIKFISSRADFYVIPHSLGILNRDAFLLTVKKFISCSPLREEERLSVDWHVNLWGHLLGEREDISLCVFQSWHICSFTIGWCRDGKISWCILLVFLPCDFYEIMDVGETEPEIDQISFPNWLMNCEKSFGSLFP